ncbi:NTP transferase domain-containing protein [Solicola sp. PLA-1-18]|uniref:phosphocholine cytidylyltransferase family protein n=1 Tax=Solicola sp. PLA-1-18 TaxID=3380532 RepID=UPI003B7B5648
MFEVVILAAGMGTRLGRPHPKPLTPLRSGQTIMRRQVEYLRDHFGPDLRITAVVGFKLEQIIEASPDIGFVYNPYFDTTNTNRSLLAALRLTGASGVLWLNGDVVFDRELLGLLDGHLDDDRTFVAVNTESVAEEEVKYTLDADGYVRELSKTVDTSVGLGEAVGINFVAAADKAVLVSRLEECDDQDYFERGIELAVERDGLRVQALDISAYPCIEVDQQEDLDHANAVLGDR